MLAVHVSIQGKPECIQLFVDATRANAQGSLREPGIVRFDLVQNLEDPCRFVLVEVYRDEPATAAHKQTVHYLRWRNAVAGMMAPPRQCSKFATLYPEPALWECS